MITLEQACEIVSNEEKTPYLASVKELPDAYVITILSAEGYGLLDASRIVDKETGKCGVYTIPLRVKTYKDLKPLEIPEQYRFPGEIKE